MSGFDDTDDVLHRFIQDDTADRLLAGRADVDGDGGLAPVAGLLAALREPGRSGELAGTNALLAQMAEVVRAGGSGISHPSRRHRMLTQLITGKVAALAAATLFSAGAAAAATGTLPDPIQRSVSHTFSHVGVDLPAPDDKPTTPGTTEGSMPSTPTTRSAQHADDSAEPASSTPVGPDAAGAAKQGLCTAFLAGGGKGKNDDAVAFKNLTDAATKAGMTVTEYCAPTTDPTTATSPTSDDHGKPSDPGKPTDPGNSGSTPAATAPGKPADAGKPSDPGKPTETGKPSAPGNRSSTPAATAPANSTSPTQPGTKGSSGSTPAGTAPAATPSSPTSPPSSHGKP